MELLYCDDRIVVCVKPAGVISTDEPGGLPDMIRQALGDPQATVRTVHRLDQAVSGLMVLARTSRAAADLSAQIREGTFQKHYLTVVHGDVPERGEMRDRLARDKTRRMTYVATEATAEAQEAVLSYERIAKDGQLSRVYVRLQTGRTHQIRVQFSSRGYPLVGDKKYGCNDDAEQIALWSCYLCFKHPRSGQVMEFTKQPPAVYPWTQI